MYTAGNEMKTTNGNTTVFEFFRSFVVSNQCVRNRHAYQNMRITVRTFERCETIKVRAIVR